MIIAIVKAQVIEGKEEKLRVIVNELQNKFAPKEEGCEGYESFIDGNTFITIERWTSQEALDIHLEQPHIKKYVPMMKKCVRGGVFSLQLINADFVQFLEI